MVKKVKSTKKTKAGSSGESGTKPAAKSAGETKKVEKIKNPPPPIPEKYLTEPAPTPPQKDGAGMFAGVLATLFVFAVLIAGAGLTSKYWWSYVEPLLPRSQFEQDPRLSVLRDRLDLLENQQSQKNDNSDQEISVFNDLEKERQKISQELATVIARLETVETTVRNVEKMAVAVSSNGENSDANSALLDISNRLSAMENQNKTSLAEQSREDEALETISKRIESLEISSSQVNANSSDSESDSIVRASALVLAVGQLRSVVREGRPYAAELAAVIATSNNNPEIKFALDVLTRRSNVGVYQLGTLRTSFEEAIIKAVQANHQSEDGSWIDDVLNKLGGLVTIRKIDGLAGIDSVDAKISRAQSSLGEGDLITVIGVIENLDGSAAEAFDVWLEDARTFMVIEKALDDLYNHVIAQLSSAQD